MDLTKLSNIEILALTIYGEARGESIEGQVAVGCVIRNRLIKGSYQSICLKPEQFSCWNENDPNHPILTEMADKLLVGQNIIDRDYQQCQWVANGVVNWFIKDNTDGAKYYLTNSLYNSTKKPHWSSNPINPKQIGNQTYFNV